MKLLIFLQTKNHSSCRYIEKLAAMHESHRRIHGNPRSKSRIVADNNVRRGLSRPRGDPLDPVERSQRQQTPFESRFR